MAVVDLPMVHIFSTQTVAKFYRRRPKVNLDMVAIAYWSGEAAPAAVGEGRWRIEVRRPYLAVRTTWPATRPAHSFFKFRAYPLNVLPSGFRFLDGDNQQIHSLRASGVISSHFARAAGSEMRTLRKSAGTLCTAPAEIAFLVMDFILHGYATSWALLVLRN